MSDKTIGEWLGLPATLLIAICFARPALAQNSCTVQLNWLTESVIKDGALLEWWYSNQNHLMYKPLELVKNGTCQFDVDQLRKQMTGASWRRDRINLLVDELVLAQKYGVAELTKSPQDGKLLCIQKLNQLAEQNSEMATSLKVQYEQIAHRPYSQQANGFGKITAGGASASCVFGLAVSTLSLFTASPLGVAICFAGSAGSFLIDEVHYATLKSENAKAVLPFGSQSTVDHLGSQIAAYDTLVEDEVMTSLFVYGDSINLSPELQPFWCSTDTSPQQRLAQIAASVQVSLKDRPIWPKVVRAHFGSCENGVVPQVQDIFTAAKD